MRFDLHTVRLVSLIALTAASAVVGQSWEAAPAFPDMTQGRTGCTAVNHAGTLYAIGGRPFSTAGDSNAAVHALSPGAVEWTQAAWLEGPIVGQGTGVDALGRIIVFGGRDGLDPEGDLGQARVYDPIDGFQDAIAARGDSAPPLNFATAVDAQRRIYSIGGGPGETATVPEPNTTHCERYDAVVNAWQPIAPLPFAVAGATAVYDGQGHVLVIGGYDAAATSRLATVLQYDIAGNTWSESAVPDLAEPISDARAVLGADNRVYLLGGQTGSVDAGVTANSVRVLDLNTNSWSPGPDMITARHSFAAALADNDFIYAMGGEDGSGGTWLVEKLYTPPCPAIVEQPPSRLAWQHQPITFSATVEGGTPLAYRWQKDGDDLHDGPTAGGGTLSGTATPSLTITNVDVLDEGDYRLVASNPCGAATSEAAVLSVRIPPEIQTNWEVVNLHPAWAGSSRANGVHGDQQVGSVTKVVDPYGSLDRPMLWTGTAASGVDLTPPGSVGGACTATAGSIQVGWWWWPYQCYVSGKWQTCHTRQACAWFGTAGSYDNLQYSGWEYSIANDTDGDQVVGTISTDDEVGNTFAHGGIWSGPNLWFQSLHPQNVSKSYTNAVWQGKQYGFIHTPFPGPQVHAAMWTDSSTTFVELHPAGAWRSYVNGAGDGQAVGSADFASAHAALWYDSRDSFADMNPPGATSSELHDAAGGLQVGSANIEGYTRAGMWAGTADSFVSLHPVLPPEFLSSSARGIYIAPDGLISVVGYGYNDHTQRTEALLWRYDPFIPMDLDRDGDVDANDVQMFTECASGPAVPLVSGCQRVDFDGDGDGDQSDHAMIQRCLSRAGNPAEASCGGR